MDPKDSKDREDNKKNGSDDKDSTASGESGPDSPRDKKPKIGAETSVREGAPSPNYMVAASPPKFVSFEEIMQAASGVSNMSLAHEIAVDSDFSFQEPELSPTSVEKQVKEVMQRAFWDSLQAKLQEDPPDYSHALILLQEVKEILIGDILLPQHRRIKAQIEEILDLELIEQKAEHGTLDFKYYADFVISIMSRLCSPARDENIAELQELTDVVPLYKGIFATLDLMKMDMANFTIQQIRPYLQQQAGDYERKKFQEFLQKQEEKGIDGLRFTRAWLERSSDKLQAQSQDGANPPVPPTPAAILNMAYIQLLQWEDNLGYPETCLMDEGRFHKLQAMTQWLSLVSSILLVTYNTVGAPISGISGLKEKLKDNVGTILAGHSFQKLPEAMPSVSEYINKEMQEVLLKHGFPEMDEAKQKLLKGQVEAVVSEDHAVHKIMRNRILDFILGLLSSPRESDVKIPVGFSAIHQDISHMCGKFLHLISHNRSVFGFYYADIIGGILKTNPSDLSPDISPR